MEKQSLNFDIWQEKLFKGIEDRYGVRVSWGKADDSMKTEKGSPIEAKSSNTVSNERTAAEADRSPEAADISLIRSEKITANVGRSPGTPVNRPIRKLLKRLVDKITGYR